MQSKYLNISDLRKITDSEGPGNRLAIWCQGCLNRCEGCCNPEMWPLEERHIVSVEDINNLIIDSYKSYNIEGITIVGGEPFLQAKSLIDICTFCHESNLSVIVFSGYTLKELKSYNNPYINSLLENIDVLIDGKYEKESKDLRGWIGSSNQTVHYLTDFYDGSIENDCDNSVEFYVNDRSVFVNGWPLNS